MKIYLYEPPIGIMAQFAFSQAPLSASVILHLPDGHCHEFNNPASSATMPPMNYPTAYLWALMQSVQDDYLRLNPAAEIVEV